MLTRRFPKFIGLLQALLIILLSSMLVLSAFAAPDNSNAKNRESEKRAQEERKASSKEDSKDRSSESEKRNQEERKAPPRDESRDRSSDSNRDRSEDSRNSANRQDDHNQGNHENRGNQDNHENRGSQGQQGSTNQGGGFIGRAIDRATRPEARSGNDALKDRDRRSNEPSFDRDKRATEMERTKWSNRYPGTPRVYVPDNNRDHRYDGHPGRWQQPSYRNGHYYYQSHPRPYRYGFWLFGDAGRNSCRRSVYYHYGYTPYVSIARIFINSYSGARYRDGDYYVSGRTPAALQDAMADIRDAWMESRVSLIERHVASGMRIAVLLDGRYDYSLNSDDYIQMTADTIDEVRTISFRWEGVRQRVEGDYTVFGRHTFRDANATTRTLYVSYTLRRFANDYLITEIDTSDVPLM